MHSKMGTEICHINKEEKHSGEHFHQNIDKAGS